MESPEIEKLHKMCIRHLKELIAQANRTCSLLDAMTGFPISLDMWNKALEQRVRENDAQARYQQARERLFDALKQER